jgi:hypothetical protein
MSEKRSKRRWYQFSLRTLLLAVLVISLPLSWLAAKLERARREKEVVEAIERIGGGTIPHSFFAATEEMANSDSSSWKPWEWKLRSWRWELRQSALFDTIEVVRLEHTAVTDADLRHLKGLRSPSYLDLTNTQITDAGLVHLEGLNSLVWISLRETQVTSEGVKKLQKALPDCEIVY